eukprot:904161-Rhodomonas_salina.3
MEAHVRASEAVLVALSTCSRRFFCEGKERRRGWRRGRARDFALMSEQKQKQRQIRTPVTEPVAFQKE